MIDCHAHLIDNKFKEDIDDVIGRAIENGVSHTVVVPEFPSQFDAVISLFNRYPQFVIPSTGVHPIRKNRKGATLEDFSALEAFLTKNEGVVKCIGEVGLDYTTSQWKIDDSSMSVMRDVLRKEAQLALHYDLPLNVHSRSAERDTLDVLIECGVKRAVLHAFGGSPEEALRGVHHGYFYSIPPSFGINDSGAPLVSALPLTHLLLESDSPVLGPVKGERNEPKNIGYSARFIAKIKGIPVETVIEETTKNAKKLFGIQI